MSENKYLNRVYTFAGYVGAVVPNNNTNTNFSIININRAFKLKSILYDVRLDVEPQIIEYKNQNGDVITGLRVGGFPQLPITEVFNFTNAALNLKSGYGFYLKTPQQVLFDSFFVDGNLPFVFEILNKSIQNINAYLSLVVEIEVI